MVVVVVGVTVVGVVDVVVDTLWQETRPYEASKGTQTFTGTTWVSLK